MAKPLDVISAVHAGDIEKVKALLQSDPALASDKD